MTEQAMDLRRAAAVLRRHSRMLTAAGGAGLLLACAYTGVQPARLSSTALVLLPTPTVSQANASDVSTQAAIAMSTPVLARAGRAIQPRLSASQVADHVAVSSPTDQLIEVDAVADRAQQAQALAQAVADAYVSYVKDVAQTVTSAPLTDLNARQGKLQDQVTALQTEIDATTARQHSETADSPDARRDAQLLAQLQAEQADVSLQLDKVKEQVATSASQGSSYGSGTTVVQPATPGTGQPLWLRLLLWGPAGYLLGLLIAAAALLVRARQDPRLTRRDDLADAVGAPVLAGVRSRPQTSVAQWSALLESSEPGPVEAWTFRQLLRALSLLGPRAAARGPAGPPGRPDHPPSLTVISLSGDERALAVGPQLAAFAASHGILTRLETATGHDCAAPLWAACAADRPTGARDLLLIRGGHWVDRPDDPAAAGEPRIELTIALAVLDRRQPSLSGCFPTAVTLLAVAPGTATREELARTAVAVDDAGRRIDAVVVADPEPSDPTTGRRLLDERARQIALPIRLTGVGSPSTMSSSDNGGRAR